MTYFIDPSAFLAILDADDENHPKAGEKWEELIEKDDTLVCSNYVLKLAVPTAYPRVAPASPACPDHFGDPSGLPTGPCILTFNYDYSNMTMVTPEVKS